MAVVVMLCVISAASTSHLWRQVPQAVAVSVVWVCVLASDSPAAIQRVSL